MFLEIPVNSSQVASSQTDMPLLVMPSAITGFGSITLAEAESSRFYADEAKTTELAREVVGADEIHVKVANLTTATSIFVDYDGIRSDYLTTDTYGRNNVWSDYVLVHHMSGATRTDLVDSTGNGRNFISQQGSPAFNQVGKIGECVTFVSSSSAFDIADDSGIDIGTNDFMFSFWKKDSGAASTNRNLFTHYDGLHGYGMEISTSDQLRSFIKDNPTRTNISQSGGEDTNWAYIVALFDRSGNAQNIKNTSASSEVSISSLSPDISNARNLIIGANYTGSTYNNWYNGSFDEIRLRDSLTGSDLSNSRDWHLTEYNNQNDNSTFWGTATPITSSWQDKK